MLLFVLASATLGVLDAALLSPPLIFRGQSGFLSAFTAPQLDALAFGILRIRQMELAANESLWGLWLVPFGLLVIRSGFIPKVIGALLLVASIGYVSMSVEFVAFPGYAPTVDRVGMLLIQGELAVILWLLVKGARVAPSAQDGGTLGAERERAQAAAATAT